MAQTDNLLPRASYTQAILQDDINPPIAKNACIAVCESSVAVAMNYFNSSKIIHTFTIAEFIMYITVADI